jgi:hypothetical protein
VCFRCAIRGHKAADERRTVEEHFEDPEQPRKDEGPDPLAGQGTGEGESGYESEREAEEDVLDEGD